MDLFGKEEVLAQKEKLLYTVMCGTQDNNIKFIDLQKILDELGFQCRIKGDHFICWKSGIEEIINIQPDKGKVKYGMVI